MQDYANIFMKLTCYTMHKLVSSEDIEQKWAYLPFNFIHIISNKLRKKILSICGKTEANVPVIRNVLQAIKVALTTLPC